MGLCKCPKKKATIQFCFEHRVNVCEHCIVTDHPKCIVQSYLQWLKDDDYSPTCELCKQQLSKGECVRLCCYHVFHMGCLSSYAKSFPPHTAPAGYTCPTCRSGLFPAENDASPVGEFLRQALSTQEWARMVYGLPPAEDSDSVPTPEKRFSPEPLPSVEVLPHSAPARQTTEPQFSRPQQWQPSPAAGLQPVAKHQSTHVDISQSQYLRTEGHSHVITGPSTPRRLYDATDGDHATHSLIDHDENKYKRRSAIEWFSRWFKSHSSSRGRHDPHRKFKRYIVIALLVVIGFFTLVMVFMRLGRASTDDDPFLDPLANPNIRNENDADS